MTFKQICDENNIDYQRARNYKNTHKELSVEEVIEYYRNKEKSFKERCKESGISYSNANGYRNRHPEKSLDEIISMYLTPKKKSFSEKCKDNNIPTSRAYHYRKLHPELSDDEVIKDLCENVKRDKLYSEINSLCLKYNLNYKSVLKFKRQHHPNITSAEKIIGYYIQGWKGKEKKASFRQMCLREGISYPTAHNFLKNHSWLTEDEVILYYKGDVLIKEKVWYESLSEFSKKCFDNGIDIRLAQSYKRGHPDLSDEDVINHYLTDSKSFVQKCKDYGLPVSRCYKYKQMNPKMSDDELIDYMLSITEPKDRNISLINTNNYHNMQIKYYYSENGENYYLCKCMLCDYKDIITIDDILNHNKEHNSTDDNS